MKKGMIVLGIGILISVIAYIFFDNNSKSSKSSSPNFGAASNAFRSMMDQGDAKEAEKNWREKYFNINF